MARQPQMKRASRAVQVGQTAYGQGVFARRRFDSDETIGVICGEHISDVDYGSDYCIDLAPGEVLEPEAPFRFLNHSCEPNCELVGNSAWDEEANALRYKTWLQSLVAIAVGEQLTIDYSWPAESAIPCLCGSANCRGWIVDPEQLDRVAKEDVAAEFVPQQ